MPDRATIEAATPKCPGCKHPIKGWQDCGRLLQWNHLHGAWTCEEHGMATLELTPV